jgi:hydrogenase nickel insertion protein HypA
MHEMSIAQGILDTALGALPKEPAKIVKIVVVAGVLAGVERECLAMYFGELSKGTAAAGAALEVTPAPARLVCRDCGHSTDYDGRGDFKTRCPQCGGMHLLQGGDELYVDHLEVEQ